MEALNWMPLDVQFVGVVYPMMHHRIHRCCWRLCREAAIKTERAEDISGTVNGLPQHGVEFDSYCSE
jgi:hypothetical protein